MSWKDKAIKMLEDSLIPVPSELNGLDWKGGLSNKTDRLAQHICAFANHKGGGLLVFGVNDDATFKSLSKEEIEDKSINNQSVRERFKLDKNNSAVASKIIADTVEAGYIKQEDETVTSRKYVTYIPYYG